MTFSGAVQLLLPSTCAGCSAPGPAVCATCAQLFAGLRRDLAGLPRLDFGADGRLPLWYWSNYAEAGALIRYWKATGNRCLTRLFTHLCAAGVAHLMQELDTREMAVVTVPSQLANRVRRGMDPVAVLVRGATKVLARENLNVRVADVLKFRGSWQSQKSQDSRDRQRNVRSKLKLRTNVQVPRRVILLDDVATTGATLGFASRLLMDGGAQVSSAMVLSLVKSRKPGYTEDKIRYDENYRIRYSRR